MFFERGYSAGSLDDIGASAGITGPSGYHHFPTKSAILEFAFERAADSLRRQSAGDGASLEVMVGDYCDFSLNNRPISRRVRAGVANVPPEALRRTHAAVREITKCWADTLTAEQPRTDERVARLQRGSRYRSSRNSFVWGISTSAGGSGQELRAVALVILRQPA